MCANIVIIPRNYRDQVAYGSRRICESYLLNGGNIPMRHTSLPSGCANLDAEPRLWLLQATELRDENPFTAPAKAIQAVNAATSCHENNVWGKVLGVWSDIGEMPIFHIVMI